MKTKRKEARVVLWQTGASCFVMSFFCSISVLAQDKAEATLVDKKALNADAKTEPEIVQEAEATADVGKKDPALKKKMDENGDPSLAAQEEESLNDDDEDYDEDEGDEEGEDFADEELYFDLENEIALDAVTASRQKEPLWQTPVPVTVVTASMIANSGARNLRDVLVTFVPGMTQVEDHNEYNVAMRGVYASSQQKLLVLLDGHQLNSRAYSMANPDYSISLDKIERIEVLRGPGSSVYGNVSLTGVINIITKTGDAIDGAQVKIGVGNWGQLTLSSLLGKTFGEHSATLWANFTQIQGEIRDIPADENYSRTDEAGSIIIDGMRDPASYDVGTVYRYRGLRILANRRTGHVVEPFSAGGHTGEIYNYDDYRRFQGVGPGLASTSNHLSARYATSLFEELAINTPALRFFKGLDLEASIYGDQNDTTVVIITNPSTQSYVTAAWKDLDFGATAQATARYDFGKWFGKGSFLVGTQLDSMELYDSILAVGSGGNWTGVVDSTENPLLELGNEMIFSGFTQLKHTLFDQVVLNVGGRFDYKLRHRGDPVFAFSPRLALMWSPLEEFSLKLSYAESFVDAPYWYRYNSLASYSGSSDLQPERLRSLQLSSTQRFFGGRLQNQVNFFANHLYNFIFRNNDAAGTLEDPFYQNAGSLRSVGVEEELAYIESFVHARVNATYQYALEAKDYGVKDGNIYNVPGLVANAIVDVDALSWLPLLFKGTEGLTQKLWFNTHLRFIGAQTAPEMTEFLDGNGDVSRSWTGNRSLDPVVLVNLGLHAKDLFLKGLTADVTVHNALDTRWVQGGSPLHPVPQAGRWFMLKMGYTFGL